jgi:hypothetical protein
MVLGNDFKALGRAVWNRVLHDYEKTADDFHSVGNNLSSYWFGSGAYYRLISGFKSYKARELLDQKEIKHDLKEMNRISNEIIRFEQKLKKFRERYAKDASKFASKIKPIAQKCSHDIDLFINVYLRFNAFIHNELAEVYEIQAKENHFIQEVLLALVRFVEAKHAHFSDELISQAKDEYVKFYNYKLRDTKEDIHDDVRLIKLDKKIEEKGKRTHFGFFAAIGTFTYSSLA